MESIIPMQIILGFTTLPKNEIKNQTTHWAQLTAYEQMNEESRYCSLYCSYRITSSILIMVVTVLILSLLLSIFQNIHNTFLNCVISRLYLKRQIKAGEEKVAKDYIISQMNNQILKFFFILNQYPKANHNSGIVQLVTADLRKFIKN